MCCSIFCVPCFSNRDYWFRTDHSHTGVETGRGSERTCFLLRWLLHESGILWGQTSLAGWWWKSLECVQSHAHKGCLAWDPKAPWLLHHELLCVQTWIMSTPSLVFNLGAIVKYREKENDPEKGQLKPLGGEGHIPPPTSSPAVWQKCHSSSQMSGFLFVPLKSCTEGPAKMLHCANAFQNDPLLNYKWVEAQK